MSLPASKLTLLNDYRAQDGLAPLKAWKQARHQPMLDAYNAKAEEVKKAAEAERARLEISKIETAKAPKAKGGKKAEKVETPAKAEKAPTYKQMANYEPSIVAKPFEVVHGFLNEHGKKLSRKEAVQTLINMGVNYSTARTQYQRWYSKNKG